MLSKFVINQQRFVVIIDELGLDGSTQSILTQLLKEENQNNVKELQLNDKLTEKETYLEFIKECNDSDDSNWNIILPTLSDMYIYNGQISIFQFVHALKNSNKIQRILLWISRPHIIHEHADYLVAGFEYMADLIVNIETDKELTICKRQPGGAIIIDRFTYERTLNEFTIEPIKSETSTVETNEENDKKQKKPEQMGTFKIELDDEELEARNALKMPYEKTSDTTEGKIIFSPDDIAESDEEDPDIDLCI